MKPFKRILRPNSSSFNDYGHEHLFDKRYCTERVQLIHAYHIIENDFKKIFDYIELSELNKNTFSHKIYDLILRSCTEFETNCKGILNDNGYGNFDNITHYFKINNASKLNDYEVRLNIWTPEPKIIRPFEEWNTLEYVPLNWYKNYNSVKHNRNENFKLASLENLINSIAGLFVILASQFGHHIFSPYQITTSFDVDDDNFISTDNSVFSVKFPEIWSNTDIVTFNWDTLKMEDEQFNNYPF